MTRMTRTSLVLRLTAAVALAFGLSACGDDLVSGESSGSSVSTSSAAGVIARTSTSTTASTASSTSTTAATTSEASTGDASAQGGTVAFTDTTYSVAPSAGSIALTIARTGSASVPISVHYQTLDGTAVAGTQYQAVAGQLEWAENDSTPKTISVPIINAASSG